jgi:hypothetical protein
VSSLSVGVCKHHHSRTHTLQTIQDSPVRSVLVETKVLVRPQCLAKQVSYTDWPSERRSASWGAQGESEKLLM